MSDLNFPEIKVRLLVTSASLSPEAMTVAIGGPPTKSWCKGDPVSRGATKRFAHNGWLVIYTESGATASAEAVVSKLLRSIDLARLQSLTLSHGDVEIELSIIVEISSSAPSVGLSADQVRQLAAIGASIDVDIYPMAENY